MKIYRGALGFIACALLLTTGCAKVTSKDVNNDALYGTYRVTYNQSSRTADYFVQYTVGSTSAGTTVELVSPSKIEVNGQEMHYTEGILQDVYYSLSDSSLLGSYDFLWTRDDGSTYKNTIPMAGAVNIQSPTNNATQLRSAAMNITVQGTALASDETFEATLEGASYPDGYAVERVSTSSGFQLTFTVDQVSKFKPGSVKLTVERVKSGTPQVGHPKYGGIIQSINTAIPNTIVFSN